MSVPNPIIIDAEVELNDLSVDADVESTDLEVDAETDSELRPMPAISIGEVQEGEEAAATMTGTYAFPVLNLVLPRGRQGETGDPGPQGPQGPQGPPGPVQSVNGKTGAVVLDATDVGALPDSYAAPVSSVNSKTGAVTLSAADVGAIPDTTTFALGYDPDCSVGLAKVGDAVTDEPFYTPSGTVTAALNWEYKNNKLYIYGVNTTFTGNGVKFAVEQEN